MNPVEACSVCRGTGYLVDIKPGDVFVRTSVHARGGGVFVVASVRPGRVEFNYGPNSSGKFVLADWSDRDIERSLTRVVEAPR